MSIKLKQEQQTWLEDQVKAGNLPSVEDGVSAAIADLKLAIEGDMDWVRPYLDEARKELAEGQAVGGDQVVAWLEKEAST